MLEEFHALRNADNVVTAWKQLYGWGTLTANVWLPSLSELVGTTGAVHPDSGVYVSAMQGLNTTTWYCVDAKGGVQFAYLKKYNASGGIAAIWRTCNQEASWLRSSYCSNATTVWRTISSTSLNISSATVSYAVHPAMDFVVRNVCKKR